MGDTVLRYASTPDQTMTAVFEAAPLWSAPDGPPTVAYYSDATYLTLVSGPSNLTQVSALVGSVPVPNLAVQDLYVDYAYRTSAGGTLLHNRNDLLRLVSADVLTGDGLCTLDEAKRHLNIDEDDDVDDAEILLFVDAASEWVTVAVSDTTPTPVKLGTLELIRHLWDTQRGPSAGPLDEEGRSRVSLGLAGFSIPNRVLEMLLPWLLPQFQPGARVQAAPRGSFPDASSRSWPDPADRVGAW